MKLQGPGDWEGHLQELKTVDVRPMMDPEPSTNPTKKRKDDPTSFGHRTLSWIWMTPGIAEDEDSLHDGQEVTQLILHCVIIYSLSALRVEWAKSRARKLRWEEEVAILQEEMRRILAYCEFRALWWENRASMHPDVPADVHEGLYGYAHEQASILRQWAKLFALQWNTPNPKHNHLSTNWTARTVDSTDDEGSDVD